jgi:hypothetical protein
MNAHKPKHEVPLPIKTKEDANIGPYIDGRDDFSPQKRKK